jgi:hypothetical protein
MRTASHKLVGRSNRTRAPTEYAAKRPLHSGMVVHLRQCSTSPSDEGGCYTSADGISCLRQPGHPPRSLPDLDYRIRLEELTSSLPRLCVIAALQLVGRVDYPREIGCVRHVVHVAISPVSWWH